MKKIQTLIVSFCSFIHLSNAQNGTHPPIKDCPVDTTNAVKITQAQVEAFFEHNSQFRTEGVIDYVPLKIHINTEEFGEKADLNKIIDQIGGLNKQFEPINLKFYICGDIDYHSTGFINSARNDPNAINIYFGNSPGSGYCGFATLAPSSNTGGFIFVQNYCIDGTTIAHEVGHYFSLHHPHDEVNGKELVDGSNCATTGDLVCDTPAEPVLLGLVDRNCQYIGTAKDPSGKSYNPKVDNIMSYTPCAKIFSPQQYQRMRYYYDNVSKAITNCELKPDISLNYKNPSFLVVKNTDKQFKIAIRNFSPKDYTGAITGSIKLVNHLGEMVYTKSIALPNKIWAAYGEDSSHFTINLPSSLPNGHYELTTSLDNTNQIGESVENNNSASLTIYLASTGNNITDAELLVTSSDAKNYVGSPYNLTYSVKNKGSAVLNNVSVDVYISKDNVVSADDSKLPKVYNGGINPGESYSTSLSISLPTDPKEKTFIIIVADLLEAVEEIDETNNEKIIDVLKLTSSTQSNKLPDFNVKSVKLLFGDTTVFGNSGSNLLDLKVENIGDTIGASQGLTAVYLSKDNAPSADDILIGQVYDYLQNPYIHFIIPENTPAGNYFLIGVIDPFNYIKEKNESNNHASYAIEVQNIPHADLVLNDLKLQDTIWKQGRTWNFTAKIKNIGNADETRYHIFAFLVNNPTIYISSFTHSINTIENDMYEVAIPKGQTLAINYSQPVTTAYPLGYKYFAVCVIESEHEIDDSLNSCYVHPKPVLITNNITASFEDDVKSLNAIAVYPNPVKDILSIQSTNEITYRLLDLQGKMLQAGKEKEINVSGFRKGTYLLQIQTSMGNSVEKITIE